MMCGYVWGTKPALVVIDPQRKFSLDVPDWQERMSSAVEGMNTLSRMFRQHGRPVIFIHFDGASHTGYSGDDGDEWLPGLMVEDTDMVVHKKHMNCFKMTDLEKVLKDSGSDCAIFSGMLTEFCVISTYFAASERGITPYLGKGSLIPYNEKGNEAAELICSMVEPAVVERFLDGDQPAIQPIE